MCRGDGVATLALVNEKGTKLFTHRVPLPEAGGGEAAGSSGARGHWRCVPDGRDAAFGVPAQVRSAPMKIRKPRAPQPARSEAETHTALVSVRGRRAVPASPRLLRARGGAGH